VVKIPNYFTTSPTEGRQSIPSGQYTNQMVKVPLLFVEIVEEKTSHFKSLFKDDSRCWRSEVTPGLLAGVEPEAHQI
jgi:hypothetical protein